MKQIEENFDAPMGVSQWMNHGRKFGYLEYFFGKNLSFDANGRLVKFCPKCNCEVTKEMLEEFDVEDCFQDKLKGRLTGR